MQDQYSRTQLLLGAEAMEKLHNSRVAVFGIGGVGGYTVEALARSGVGALDLIDDDKVCLTNLNRQLHATLGAAGLVRAAAFSWHRAARETLAVYNEALEARTSTLAAA